MIILKIIFNSKLKNHEAGELNLNYTQNLLPLSSQALHYHKFLFFPNCFNISKVKFLVAIASALQPHQHTIPL